MKTLVILGAGGHGRVVADCAELIGNYDCIKFVDDCFADRKHNNHWPIIGNTNTWVEHLKTADFIVAFGKNELRYNTLKALNKLQANIISLVHPKAVVSPHAKIGKGVVVFANAVVNIGAVIHDGCIINTGATIDHDCIIKDAVHISPGANIAGGVTIGSCSWLGIGCSVVEYIELAENTQVGAGAAVIKPTEPNSLYLGVPAKRIK